MTRFHLALLAIVSFAVGITAPYEVDFHNFYRAGQDILSGLNPYLQTGYFNPIHVAIAYTPISLLPIELASRIHAGTMFGIYVLAMSRLLRGNVLAVALFAPFGLAIAYYNNLDALVLLGVTLPAPIGVWLLLAKPQIGLFAAALMLWKFGSWKLVLAIGTTLVVSLALGMIHGGLGTGASMSLWPWGIAIGAMLMWLACKKKDAVIAMGASAFLSPYVTILNWSAALPLFRANRKLMALGVALSWSVVILWRSRI